jgi:hypothetical protein
MKENCIMITRHGNTDRESGKKKYLEKKPVPVAIYPPQIPHVMM